MMGIWVAIPLNDGIVGSSCNKFDPDIPSSGKLNIPVMHP